MPKPRANETERDFLTRCMLDDESRTDFPDSDQRLAFCYSQYENKNHKNTFDKKFVKRWKNDYEKKLKSSENKVIPKVNRFYQSEYYKGVDKFIETERTEYMDLFHYEFFQNIYKEIYKDIGIDIAKWYVNNFEKYQTKEFNSKDYISIWLANFTAYGVRVAAANIVGVSATAKKTLIRLTRKLFSDPLYATLGAAEKARILRKQFKHYSRFQAIRLVRTESTRIANYAMQVSANELFAGRKIMKQWMASLDGREREWHGIANGQIVENDKNFIVGGESMPRPGEGSGRNVINCRCSVFYFPEKDDGSIFG